MRKLLCILLIYISYNALAKDARNDVAKLPKDFAQCNGGYSAYYYVGAFGSQGTIGNGVNIPAKLWMLITPVNPNKKPYAFVLDNADDAVIDKPISKEALEYFLGYKL
jgi:hypothetical protein